MKAVKNYKVDVRSGPIAKVIEQLTGYALYESQDSRDAKRVANFLNGGNGFNGFTPSFFLNTWVVPSF